MSTDTKTDAEKREALRARIESSEQRNAQRSFVDQAKGAADGALDYVKANPLKAVAAAAVGALVVGALTRPGRRAGARAGRRAGTLATLATDAALAYGLNLFDSASSGAKKGGNRLSELGLSARNKARLWSRGTANDGVEIADIVRDAAKRGGRRGTRTIDALRSRLTH